MHIDERDLRELEQLQRPGANLVITGHMPSDSIGMNRSSQPGTARHRSNRGLRSYKGLDHIEEDRLDASPKAYGNEAERRYHLRRLDDLLEALERLNLAEAKAYRWRSRNASRKKDHGRGGHQFQQLIELVWPSRRNT